jgi:hypothetical protein
MSPFMAQSGHCVMSGYLSAFGGKADRLPYSITSHSAN